MNREARRAWKRGKVAGDLEVRLRVAAAEARARADEAAQRVIDEIEALPEGEREARWMVELERCVEALRRERS